MRVVVGWVFVMFSVRICGYFFKFEGEWRMGGGEYGGYGVRLVVGIVREF